MGQGMCAGIRDAANLAWKLALCIKGQAATALLDSYQQERGPNVRQFIETAMRLGGLINSMDRETALAQAASRDTGTARMASIAPPLGDSDLVTFETPHRGYLSSQPMLSDGQRLDDVTGYQPVLVLRRPLPEGVAIIAQTFDAETVPNLATVLDDFDTNALLIRPDRYIAASAIEDEDIAKIASLALPCGK
jgi:3-(3-hydroxy-phenyl)propionate hydroxylase